MVSHDLPVELLHFRIYFEIIESVDRVGILDNQKGGNGGLVLARKADLGFDAELLLVELEGEPDLFYVVRAVVDFYITNAIR